jgi:hypothetical protein
VNAPRLLVLAAAGALLAVPAVATADTATVAICHADRADSHPYVLNEPAKSGDVSGHAEHTGPVWNAGLKAEHDSWGDIIPEFDYVEDGVTKHFPGLNWDEAGQAIHANGCEVTTDEGSTTGEDDGSTTGDDGSTTGDDGSTTGDDGSTGGEGGGAVTTGESPELTPEQPFTGGGGTTSTPASLPHTGLELWTLFAAGLVLVTGGTWITVAPATARR